MYDAGVRNILTIWDLSNFPPARFCLVIIQPAVVLSARDSNVPTARLYPTLPLLHFPHCLFYSIFIQNTTINQFFLFVFCQTLLVDDFSGTPILNEIVELLVFVLPCQFDFAILMQKRRLVQSI
jgi:hypothetical protein